MITIPHTVIIGVFIVIIVPVIVRVSIVHFRVTSVATVSIISGIMVTLSVTIVAVCGTHVPIIHRCACIVVMIAITHTVVVAIFVVIIAGIILILFVTLVIVSATFVSNIRGCAPVMIIIVCPILVTAFVVATVVTFWWVVIFVGVFSRCGKGLVCIRKNCRGSMSPRISTVPGFGAIVRIMRAISVRLIITLCATSTKTSYIFVVQVCNRATLFMACKPTRSKVVVI